MSHFEAYILHFQEIIVYKIPPGGGEGSIASLRSTRIWFAFDTLLLICSPNFMFLSKMTPKSFSQSTFLTLIGPFGVSIINSVSGKLFPIWRW